MTAAAPAASTPRASLDALARNGDDIEGWCTPGGFLSSL